MSRLIDVDALIKDFDKRCFGECCCCIESTNTESGCKVIDDQPTVDAVPVIRCIECKYASFSFHQGELYISCENTEGLLRDVPEDGYCYCGEKVTE